jgi:amino acid transporter
METLAQSVSTIAPTTTPAATIPLVCALAGNGTWLAYVLATVAILLVALCVSRFARYSASPGSLYTYASMILPPWLGATAAWSLLLAYIATGSSVIGGFYHYANLLLHDATGHGSSAVLLALIVTVISMGIAWQDVKISARLMLWIEASSVTLIMTVVVLVLVRHGLHLEWTQLRLRGMTGSGLRLGLVLALFSFVGFESATTLGSEAQNPLKTIPARGYTERPAGRIHFHPLRLHRSTWVAYRRARPGRQPGTYACACWRGRGAGSGIAD